MTVMLLSTAWVVARFLYRDKLSELFGKLDRKVNRVVNATLVAILLVYSLRIFLLWFDSR